MPARTPFNFIDGSYRDDTRPFSVQDTVNYIPVLAEQGGTRSPIMLRSAPGYIDFCNISPFPIRGARNVEGKFLVVSGNSLVRVNNDGTFTDLGAIPGVGPVYMSHNQVTGGNQVLIANGMSGYVYNTVDNTLVQITDDAYPGAIAVDYIDQYLVQIEPGRRFWFHSELADALSYNSLDRYEAEASPDLMTGLIVSNQQVWVFSERTTQQFTNIGAATNTFASSQGTVIEIGCVARGTINKSDNVVFWYGSNGSVYLAEGYTPVRISTHPIEQALARCNPANMLSYVWEDRGHKVYYITCPDGYTWGYDLTTKRWHRRQSYGYNRWRLNTLTFWNGAWYGGDFQTGKIYRLSWGIMREGDQPLVSERIGAVGSDVQNSITIDSIELVVDTGVMEDADDFVPPPPPVYSIVVSETYADPTIGVLYSSSNPGATGGFAPYTWSIDSIPAGLSINPATGQITGTPTTGGVTNFILTATDRYGVAGTIAGQMTVVFSSDLVTYDTTLKILSGASIAYPQIQSITHPQTPLAYSTTADALYLLTASGAGSVRVFKSAGGGTYSPLTTPLSPAAGSSDAVAISHDGIYMAVVQGTSVVVYKKNVGDTWSSIQTLTNTQVRFGVKFSPSSEYLATCGNQAGEYLRVYRRSGDVFTLIFSGGSNDGISVSWSDDSTKLAFAPRLSNPVIFSVSGSSVTTLATASVPVSGTGCCILSPDGSVLFIRVNAGGTPFSIYQRSGAVLNLMPNPVPAPTFTSSLPFDVTADGRVMAIYDGGGIIRIYGVSGATLTHLGTVSVATASTVGTHYVKSADYS